MIDEKRLREALLDYFGTAMPFFPAAAVDVAKVERASCEELVEMAKKCGININKYIS